MNRKADRRPSQWISVLASIVSVLAVAMPAWCSGQEVDFNQDVRPILLRSCLACHGPDEDHREADVRLDTAEGLLEVIEPGDPDSSVFFERVSADDPDMQMPPADHADRLKDAEIDLLRRWIEQGANYQTHWAFAPPQQHELPDHRFKPWCRQPLDHFIARRLESLGLAPNPDAEPARVIRRVALDLTGLPPTADQVSRFVADPSDTTYEAIVDELLAAPAYGEHWAAMWMDLARYADTMGYASDNPRTIWPWRDWLVQRLNDNVPYDRLGTEMLAGDLLPDASDEQKLATAFHRNTLNNTEGGTNDEEFRTIAVKDRLSTTLNTWMGLTVRCAECHNHKYDPISQLEYYRLLDFFNQTADADTNDDRPLLAVYPAGREAEWARLDQQIEQTEREIAELGTPAEDDEAAQKKKQELDQKLEKLKTARQAPVNVPVLQELPTEQRRTTHLMIRGSYLALGEAVQAQVPEAFHAWPDGAPRNRLGLAQWLFDPANPLTARVAVNRFWARMFGRGIVLTEEDFGTQGTLPTHPDLLDWLAVDFRNHGWNVKRLLKQLALSSTYRQSARLDSDDKRSIDPDNRWLSRGPRVRLRAEVVRDQALAVSGLLSSKRFGPPVYPPNPVKQVRSAFVGVTVWNDSQGEDRYRRTLYTYLKRSAPHPFFDNFDVGARDVCRMRRIRTNTPSQALQTLNDVMFLEAARAFARSMMQSNGSVAEQIDAGFQMALFRPARSDEVDRLQKLYDSSRGYYLAHPDDARKLIATEKSTGDDSLAEWAAMTVVANVIMNLDEFLTH